MTVKIHGSGLHSPEYSTISPKFLDPTACIIGRHLRYCRSAASHQEKSVAWPIRGAFGSMHLCNQSDYVQVSANVEACGGWVVSVCVTVL